MEKSYNLICKIENCNNKVKAVTMNNFNYSKLFCEEHANGIKCNCEDCNIEIIMKPSRYISRDKNFPILCKKCSDKRKILKINYGNDLIDKECYFCHKIYKESFRNHGFNYKGKIIHTCEECSFIEKICKECGKKYKISIAFDESSKYCSQKCASIANCKIMLQSEKLSVENRTKRAQYEIENKIGIFSDEIKQLNKENILKQKENKIGIFNPEIQLKASKLGIEAQRNNNLGFFSQDQQNRMHNTQRENNNLGFVNKLCNICNKITLHNGDVCTECNNYAGGFHFNYCKNCNKNTLHNGSICIVCNPKAAGSLNYKILNFCISCNCETPHKYDKNGELYCQVCAGEKVWCKKHQIFESISYNSDPSHGIFYKSKTKNWIQNYYEQFNYIQLLIDFKDNILDSETVRGIYLWRIDDIPYYCGDSGDILSRSYDHMYEIWNSPEYWLNIKDDSINMNHSISLEVLEVCDNFISDQEMHERQIEWINKLKPISQKCDGTDHIIQLNRRKYDINNLKEIYYIRLNKEEG